MSGYDPRLVVYPDRLPPDPELDREHADRTRRAEIEALLVEREGVLRRRKDAHNHQRDALVVVDETGRRVSGLRIVRLSGAELREQLEQDLAGIDAALAAVDRELRARGAEPPEAAP